MSLFLGGWNIGYGFMYPAGLVGALMAMAVFLLKVFGLVFFFIWIRWSLPRFRYDQVMRLGWRYLLPLAIVNLVFNAIIVALVESLS